MAKEQLNKIKVVLTEKNRTNKWLAEHLKKYQATASKWVTKTNQSDLKSIMRKAELLDVDLNSLVRFSKKD